MTSRLSLIKLALGAVLTCLIAMKLVQWRYLARGYNLMIGIEGSGSFSRHHLTFPMWRQIEPSITVLAMVVGSLLILRHKALGLTVVASATLLTLILGVWDVWWSGTLHSPTSLWLLLNTLLVLVAAAYLKQGLAARQNA
jgi:hypothetical protein